MHRLSENYYHRKCYIENNQVPTQTVMKNKMGPDLAMIYFKSMSPKLKVLAGLEPPLKGGGDEWYMPPEEILAGRHVLKPVNLKELKLLRYEGIKTLGEKFRNIHFQNMIKEKSDALAKSDLEWKTVILDSNRKYYAQCEKVESAKNTEKLHLALEQFELMFRQAVTKIEDIVMAAATKEVIRIRNDAFNYMKKHYAELLDYQARTLYDYYENMLKEQKDKIKINFIKDIKEIRSNMGNKIQDIHRDKHISIEKLRHFLMCQNLACQVFVALTEREACKRETEQINKDQNKKIKNIKEDIALKDLEIHLRLDQNKKREAFIKIWQKKVCHIVKKFQMFVQYCLNTLPEQAEFFINLEKLMFIQLSESLENPSFESIIEPEKSEIKETTEALKPHPFYLFCDTGSTPSIDQNLCPIHCTSSASEVPVTVINKRYIYTACDNTAKFPDKVSRYLSGIEGDDTDFYDENNYENHVPVKITSSQQLLQLKLQSSLMQILQKELPNIKELPIECGECKLSYCFCTTQEELPKSSEHIQTPLDTRVYKTVLPPGRNIERADELKLTREPKWDSYFKFVEPKHFKCAVTAKKHLKEHLPPYMQQMSPYGPPELPKYEICNINELKRMVKRARNIITPPPSQPEPPSKFSTVGVQYSDTDFEYLCTCFSDNELVKFIEKIKQENYDIKARVVGDPNTDSFLNKSATSFATERAHSLRRLLGDHPSLKQIFKSSDCRMYGKKC